MQRQTRRRRPGEGAGTDAIRRRQELGVVQTSLSELPLFTAAKKGEVRITLRSVARAPPLESCGMQNPGKIVSRPRRHELNIAFCGWRW